MKSPNTFVTELMRAPIMGVDARSQVRATLAHSDNNEVHFFGVLRHGRVVGQACVCDLRDASPDSPMSAVMQPLIITLSPERFTVRVSPSTVFSFLPSARSEASSLPATT